MKPEAVVSRVDHFASSEASGGAVREVVDTDEFPDEGADGFRVRSDLQPFVERAAFVGLEVAPGDVAEGRRIDEARHGVAQSGEHGPQPRVEKQGRLVANEEVVELHVEFRDVEGEAEKVGSDFVDGDHGWTRNRSGRVRKTARPKQA